MSSNQTPMRVESDYMEALRCGVCCHCSDPAPRGSMLHPGNDCIRANVRRVIERDNEPHPDLMGCLYGSYQSDKAAAWSWYSLSLKMRSFFPRERTLRRH